MYVIATEIQETVGTVSTEDIENTLTVTIQLTVVMPCPHR